MANPCAVWVAPPAQGFVASADTRVTLRAMSDDATTEDPAPFEPDDRPPRWGVVIAGYGGYIAPGEIAKIETVRSGTNYFVMAHLRGQVAVGEASQRSTLFLTPPLDSEEEAHRICDRMCDTWFVVLSTNPETGGAHWPTPEPPPEQRFGLA